MGLKFLIPGCFWVGKFGKYFFGVARSSLSIKIESNLPPGGGGWGGELMHQSLAIMVLLTLPCTTNPHHQDQGTMANMS